MAPWWYNLGIEVYADRPRNTWQRIGRQLMMATDPVDVDGLTAGESLERAGFTTLREASADGSVTILARDPWDTPVRVSQASHLPFISS